MTVLETLNSPQFERYMLNEHIEVLRKAECAAEENARKVEERNPGDRFGQRVVQHDLEVATKALKYSVETGLSRKDTGLLVLSCYLQDFGRSICALPFNERIAYVPESFKELPWADDRKAQHMHGEMGVFAIQRSDLLAGFTDPEKQIILDNVLNHGKVDPDLISSIDFKTVITEQDPSYSFCLLGRKFDSTELVARTDFMTVDGAWGQFKLWGLDKDHFSDTKLSYILSDNALLEADIRGYLRSLLIDQEFPNPILFRSGERTDSEQQLWNNVCAWFSAESSDELLERASSWARGDTDQLPTMIKSPTSNELIESYSNYMLSQVFIAIRNAAQSIEKEMLKSEAIKQRVGYLQLINGTERLMDHLSPALQKAAAPNS